MNLIELKKYSMAEAIYIEAFGVSSEELENKPREEVIADYAYLEENVEEALATLTEREKMILRLVLGDKLTLRAAGAELYVSGERVRQFLNRAFRKLRHPARKYILDGSRRKAQIEAEAEEQRKAAIAERWTKTGAEIERRKVVERDKRSAYLQSNIEWLSLTPICVEKLHALEVETIGELLEKFPYDPQTNGLTGLTVADGIEEIDYQEIWCKLFDAGFILRMPELPDFDTLKKAEQSALPRNAASNIMDMSILELELSVRSYNCLTRAGIQSVGGLLNRLDLGVSEVLEMERHEAADAIFRLNIRNMGRKSAEEIVNQLHDTLNSAI